MDELVALLKSPLTEDELNKMMPEPDNSQQAPEPDAYTQVLNQFTQRNTEALVRCKSCSLLSKSHNLCIFKINLSFVQCVSS